jgi:CxxC-x17-CxxC domain-containing protein
MNDFKKRNKFGAGEKGDRRGGNAGKRDFNKSHFGGSRNSGMELFQATCAGCGKTCEVPFRPNGKKPVYCRECFDRNNGGSTRPERPERSERFERPSYRQEQPHVSSGSELQEIKRNIDALHAKMDAVIKKLG